jgi:hypothetical protein
METLKEKWATQDCAMVIVNQNGVVKVGGPAAQEQEAIVYVFLLEE